MIIKIEKSKYYGYQNKTKELFKKKYRSLKLKWTESVKLGDNVVDGWISDDRTQYLLKLPEEGNYKRFTGNSVGMIEFLKLHGGVEFEGEEKGTHINYDDDMGFRTQQDRFGRFVGGDLYNHYRVEEMLKDMPESWEVKWGDGGFLKNKDNNVDKSIVKKKVIRKIVRRKK